MEYVATGINKMGDAFTALAAANPQQKVTDQSSTSKRSFAEIEEGETSDEYDDTDDVKSLLNSATGKTSQSSESKDLNESCSGSVLEEMDALLEDDDDVGPVVAAKLANITNKAFQSIMLLKVSRKRRKFIKGLKIVIR